MIWVSATKKIKIAPFQKIYNRIFCITFTQQFYNNQIQ